MTRYAKMKKRRDHWKKKTVEANARLRYQRSESKRLQAERNRYKKALRATRAELDEQKRRNALPTVTGKVDVIFLQYLRQLPMTR